MNDVIMIGADDHNVDRRRDGWRDAPEASNFPVRYSILTLA